VVRRAEERWRSGAVRLPSVEGFVRQVMGWREYMWHLYWHFGDEYRHADALGAAEPVPSWFADLDGDATDARCLSDVLGHVGDDGWVHHIPRLMVLGSYALQRGWRPREVTDFFHRSFVDGYDWVMVANVVGMSQHADGGALATKPYTSGGAYIDRMSDYCRGCRFDPRTRLGPDACPFTAGYWAFLDRNRERLAANPRMRNALRGLDRLGDLSEVVAQEQRRGAGAP
jgi:deoxyribodipyrimidine photolyase-related protein